MGDSKRASRRETRRKTEYGRYTAESERQSHSRNGLYSVAGPDGGRFETGTGTEGRKRAKALAAALDAANANSMDCLPPCSDSSERPTRWGDDAGEWEAWASEAATVPAVFLSDGKPAAAGYLYAVHQLGKAQIARKLGVSEQTVRQYLSDLRAGRRS